MKIFQTEYHYVIEGEDYQGKFQMRITKDLSQIQVENDMDNEFPGDDVHVNVNRSEIREIRDFLTGIIDANS